jgi:hypothetical protein
MSLMPALALIIALQAEAVQPPRVKIVFEAMEPQPAREQSG